MKHLRLAPMLALAAWAGLAAPGHAQLTINYDFAPGATVPDNGQVSQVQVLGGLSGLSTFTNVVTRLNLTNGGGTDNPMYLGDLYSSLTLGQSGEAQRVAVLLNRPGRDNTNQFGSGLGSLNAILDDTVVSGKTNVFTATGDGTYYADGRSTVNPGGSAVPFAGGTAGLGALNGGPLASNRVSLLVADYSQGGVATLSNWGVSVTGTAVATTGTTFTPGANSSISDTGVDATNNVGATLDTTGATGGALVLKLAGTTTLAGGVTGGGGITKTGAGTLILSATGDYTGATVVNGGTLLVNGGVAGTSSGTGAGSVTVNNTGSLLGGTGAISGTVKINPEAVLTGGTRGSSAAVTAENVGKLSVGALTLTTGSIFHADLLSATSFDQIASLGAVTLGGATLELSLAAGITIDPGQVFRLIDNGSSSALGGTFDGLAQGSTITADGYTFTVNYTGGSGNDLDLVAVPEPVTLLGGVLLLAAAGWGQRRRLWAAGGGLKRSLVG